MFIEDVPREYYPKAVKRAFRVLTDFVCTGDCEYCKLYMDIDEPINDVRRAFCSVALMQHYFDTIEQNKNA